MSGEKKAEAKKKYTPLRWTLAQAASEFHLGPKTVTHRAKAAGIIPGEDGKFSTKDIHCAVCGDYHRERTRKMAEDADAQALANAEERKRLVDREDLMRRLEPIYVRMKEIIMRSGMAESEKGEVLVQLVKLHEV